MSPALIESLEALPAMMAEARDPWWVIASAAMALHGADVTVADIDLLASDRDGRLLLDRYGFVPLDTVPSAAFRSTIYARRHATPVPIELMADFHVYREDRWHPIVPETRLWLPAGRASIPVPSIPDLIEHCGWFGRSKDAQRAAILQRLLD